jgi:hypothetical protein
MSQTVLRSGLNVMARLDRAISLHRVAADGSVEPSHDGIGVCNQAKNR